MPRTPEDFAETPKSQEQATALPPDALSPVLELARLSAGTVYQVSPRAPFLIEDRTGSATLLLVETGSVRLRVDGESQEWQLTRGDLALLVHGRRFLLADRDGFAGKTVDGNHEPWDPARRLIGSGGNDRWLAARFAIDPILAKHLLAVLPPVLILKSDDGRAPDWLDTVTGAMMREATSGAPGAQVIVNRLLELAFTNILRRWAASSQTSAGWLSAALDDRIGRVIAAIHAAPERSWPVQALARLAGMSRSSFADRFQALVGYTPAAYVACWRLDRATMLLRMSDLPVATVASRSGYRSAAAFSRAFREYFRVSPQAWRQEKASSAG